MRNVENGMTMIDNDQEKWNQATNWSIGLFTHSDIDTLYIDRLTNRFMDLLTDSLIRQSIEWLLLLYFR